MVMLKAGLILLKYFPTDNYQKVRSWQEADVLRPSVELTAHTHQSRNQHHKSKKYMNAGFSLSQHPAVVDSLMLSATAKAA